MHNPPRPVVDYVYAATIIRWVDGDTVDVSIDLGFRLAMVQRLRLHGCDTPERGRPGATQATAASKALAPAGGKVVIATFHDVAETFGRYVADLWLADGRYLSAVLIEAGLAREFMV